MKAQKMTLLDEFVNAVQKQSADGHYQVLAETCRKAISDVLPKFKPQLDNVGQMFDIQHHSPAVIAIIYVKLCHEPLPTNITEMLDRIEQFFIACNGEQMRYMNDIYTDICHKITDIVLARNMPARGISIMLNAIDKIRISPSQLTSIHSDLCQLCLASKILKPALDILDSDITDIQTEVGVKGGFDSKFYLCYYYYGGTIYATMKNYNRALFFFENVLTIPCSVISRIMIEAYKKFILVHLLHLGKSISLPKYTSTIVSRFMRNHCQAYTELSDGFMSFDSDKFNAIMIKHQITYCGDKNYGLVKLVKESLIKRNIQRLTNTFITLSIVDVANRCKLDGPVEAEQYIRNMIEDGEIYATISERDGMVYFKDNPQEYNDPNVLKDIDFLIESGISQEKLLTAMDRRIMLTNEYAKKAYKTSSSFAAEGDEGLGLAGSGSFRGDTQFLDGL